MWAVATIVRFIPGVLGALAAYLLSKLVDWAMTFSVDLAVFLLTYLVVTALLEAALRHYGSRRGER